ncbi:hypothetical protein RhiirA5_406129 [Rhizophagus irregularis]|uniref:Uncharacterized protein n=2 Tax=Rhizophagus irregularis TaxID=588596 RepID=A0A2I1DZY1_9GLOM|nr:hypothetical protein GLOIN_2v1775969 [Rhizophagus irregularis DAOM 181602=DAOM 197198]PKC17214.1 hypothetical protein RhiirA5_406129 [Rhizophagus irregularis]PKC74166.1 hypothetical protein RhiirA1_450327 [Rhizophagus irregularis]PKY15431.1 hypothetical protein RhiirB3_427649 [Rhizophagus irregularis]POG70352.1 hypothetical protein GLOIN_2v1775969 [Rhizophagus irregularis DAOM 181602=DAOM 197198]|eukprot:XP_025177218.1 hypothetical protein GLOIN_2v1775969 [Rhizophagus irregularis DAOM 181602=DAOM 197198]
MEKLKSSGKDYDLRPFIVQIRDLETQLRDIATSEYINLPNNKLSYGAMVFVRAMIVTNVRISLARTATIAAAV